MDSLFHFQGTSSKAQLKKTENGGGFYSEQETSTADLNKDKNQQAQKSGFAIKIDSGYATDDSGDGTPSNKDYQEVAKSGFAKQSKFQIMNTMSHPGDQEAADEQDDDFTTGSEISQTEETKGINSQEKPNTPKINRDTSKLINLNAKSQKDIKSKFLASNTTGHVDSDAQAKNIVKQNDAVESMQNHPYRHLIFGNNVKDSLFKKHLEITYRGLVYAVKCLQGPSEQFIKTKQVVVPEPKNPQLNTLLLDLDETLIHSCSLKENPQHIVKAKGDMGQEVKIGINIRPYCMEFLQKASNFWDIYVYTASSPSYASAIVRYIDPQSKYIYGILNRTNCMETKNGFFIKDLRILKNRDLKHMVLVDNLAHSFGFQIENGIPILEWHNDQSDLQLRYLLAYLIECAQSQDKRIFNKSRLKLAELAEANLDELQ